LAEDEGDFKSVLYLKMISKVELELKKVPLIWITVSLNFKVKFIDTEWEKLTFKVS